MKLKDLENFLFSQHKAFFQFAMTLTSDRDISEKIIQDSQYLLLSEENDEIKSLMLKKNNPTDFFKHARRFVLGTIYKIAKKNNLFQPPRGGKISDKAFWTLSMDQRAVLCLRHRLKLNKEEISHLLGLTQVEYYNLLNISREALLKNTGRFNHDARDTY